MKNKLLFSFIALVLAACSPQASQPTPLAVVDGNFSGSASQFVVTEAELGGQYTQAFEVETGSSEDRIPDLLDTEEAGWQVQFARPIGVAEDGTLPLYLVSTARVQSSAEDAQAALNQDQNLEAALADGTLVQMADIPGIDPNSQIVLQYPDGVVQVVVVYRNVTLSFFGRSEGEEADLYQYLANLAKSHIAWLESREL